MIYFHFFIYMEIEAMVDGEVVRAGSIILELYNLKKIWEDIKNICFDSSIRQAKDNQV